jgi:hypothetical protein
MSKTEGRDIKKDRKEIRRSVEELMPTLLTDGLVGAVQKEMNARIDKIESYCKENLTKQDIRAQKILGFIVQEVKSNIANDLHSMKIMSIALTEIMAEKLGAFSQALTAVNTRLNALAPLEEGVEDVTKTALDGLNPEDFGKILADKQVDVMKRLTSEAEARMQERMQLTAEAETPVTPPETETNTDEASPEVPTPAPEAPAPNAE